MKQIAMYSTVIFFTVILYACHKTDNHCPESMYLGQLYWSDQTEKWLPNKYLHLPSTLKFRSETGQVAEFIMQSAQVFENHITSFFILCENGDSTRVSWAARRFGTQYLGPNSLVISGAIGVWNEKLVLDKVVEPDYYEWVSVSMYRLYSGYLTDFGRVRIITDLRNAERVDIDHPSEHFTILENFEFMGEVYQQVYSDGDPDSPEAVIYFVKGKGIVGYADEEGLQWKLIE